MKKIAGAFLAAALTLSSFSAVFAQSGDMGFFGGITEGVRLPKTTELILHDDRARNQGVVNLPYKETIFLSGVPVTYEGLLDIRYSGNVVDTDDSGTYRVAYVVHDSATTDENIRIDRNLSFNVNWRREGKQIIKDYTVNSWSETISTGAGEFTIDRTQSHFDISILEDKTPGVTYYKGDVSQRAVYTNGTVPTILEVNSSLYGYTSAWSNTETHRIDGLVTTPDWQMSYQIRPSVTVGKTLQYSQNEPNLISFSGNYREHMSNKSGANYDIFTLPQRFYGTEKTGSISMSTHNTFEQLIAPDVSFLKGHFAEADISKVFSMQLVDGDPKFFQPNQAITRGQFVTMLTKAVKLPVDLKEQEQALKSKKKVTLNIVFPDVLPEREDYPYIMAAYRSGLAVGRGSGHFHVDSNIQREEAIVILLRTLGLQNLGLDKTPVTMFVDDEKISDWAKREVYAAARIGLIYGDENGNFNPKAYITKAEAAALTNRLIEYMRKELVTDYTEYIVNYPN